MAKPNPSARLKKFDKARHDPRIEIWRMLLVLVESIYSDLEKKLNEKGCTYPRFRLLFVLYFEGPCSPASLAKRFRVSRSNLTTFLRRLEVDELVYACPVASTDSRLKYVLTDKGNDYIEELMTFHFENVKGLNLFARPQLVTELKLFLKQHNESSTI